MLKRISCALAGLAVGLVAVRPADAFYIGPLTEQNGYTLEVVTTTQLSITILVVTSRGRLEAEEVRVFEPNAPVESRTIARNVNRVIMMVDSHPGGQGGIVKISQGANRFEIAVTSTESIVFDVSH